MATIAAVAPAAALDKIKFPYSPISYHSLPFLVAYEGKLFERHGLEVDPIFAGASSLIVQSMLAGEANLAGMAGPAVISNVLKGGDVIHPNMKLRLPAKPIAAATPAEPAVPSAERLRRQMSAARSLGEVARLLTLPREFVAELSPEVVASALRRVAAEDRLVAGWLDALTASGPIGALTEELATARAANAALQSRVDELEEWWTALEQSTDPGAAIRQPGS